MTDDSSKRLHQSVEMVKQRVLQVVAAVVLVLLFLGPPAAIAYMALSGYPLWETRTVEKTVHGGLIVEATPILIIWSLILMMFWGTATGRLPRP